MYTIQAIHSDAQTLEGLITQATTDTNNSDAFTEDEGSTILTAIQALTPNIVTALQNLDSQHDNFASQPIAGLDAVVESDLNTLNTDTTAFENALLSKAPAVSHTISPLGDGASLRSRQDDQSAAQTVIDEINAAFATAISTYSS